MKYQGCPRCGGRRYDYNGFTSLRRDQKNPCWRCGGEGQIPDVAIAPPAAIIAPVVTILGFLALLIIALAP